MKPPIWYTQNEMEHYLRCQNYSPLIAQELARDYAVNLQLSFNKGFEIGKRTAAKERNKKVEPLRRETCKLCHSSVVDWVDPDWSDGRICRPCETKYAPETQR